MKSRTQVERAAPLRSGIARDFLTAYESRDFGRARSLLSEHGLFLWFNTDAHQLGRVIEEIVRADNTQRDTAFGFHLFLSFMQSGSSFDPSAFPAASTTSAPQAVALPVAYAFELRLRGHVREAHEHSQRLFQNASLIQPFADSRDGWAQLVALQRGITAMLAGELTEALHFFQEARTRATTPGLEFLLRDALAKSALIHAAFGDPVEAEILLRQAERVFRTESWAEAVIDATVQLSSVLLEVDAAQASILLSELDLSQVGEMWPFYAHAQYRVCENAGSHSQAAKTTAQLKALPFPRVEGQGYNGSVFHLAEASNCVASGSLKQARAHLAHADPDFVLTRIIRVLIETQVGSFQKAIDLAHDTREATVFLRRLEVWRISVIAHAYMMLGEESHAVEALKAVEAFPRPLLPHEAEFFSSELRVLGEMTLPRWPAATKPETTYMDRLPNQDTQLTDREHEVLRALATDKSRKDVAADLFISLNTLKSQIRAVYRKLGASSREEALRNATTRGLL